MISTVESYVSRGFVVGLNPTEMEFLHLTGAFSCRIFPVKSTISVKIWHFSLIFLCYGNLLIKNKRRKTARVCSHIPDNENKKNL